MSQAPVVSPQRSRAEDVDLPAIVIKNPLLSSFIPTTGHRDGCRRPISDIYDFQIVDPRDDSQMQDTDGVHRADVSTLPNSLEANVTPTAVVGDSRREPVSEKRY